MFKPGQSGNPSGRPKGSKNVAGRLLGELEDDLPALLEATKKKALGGDTAALRLLLERTLPAKKPEGKAVSIPALIDAQTLTDKATAIVDAIASGDIAPDIGAQLISAIGATAKITEFDDLLKRIEALENAG